MIYVCERKDAAVKVLCEGCDCGMVIEGSLFEDVGGFHRKFGLPASPEQRPVALDDATLRFRVGFMLEELAEFCRAHGLSPLSDHLGGAAVMLKHGAYWNDRVADLEASADALADLVWVALGTAHMMGLPFDEVWAEIRRANMAKERASGADDPRSKRGSALDVVKPDGWRGPDHRAAIAEAGRCRHVRTKVIDRTVDNMMGNVVCADCGVFIRTYDAG